MNHWSVKENDAALVLSGTRAKSGNAIRMASANSQDSAEDRSRVAGVTCRRNGEKAQRLVAVVSSVVGIHFGQLAEVPEGLDGHAVRRSHCWNESAVGNRKVEAG